MKVRFQRVDGNDDLPVPAPMTTGSAGMDLRACLPEPVTLDGGQRALIPTGFRVEIPAGLEGQVRPRSGLAIRHGVTLLNTPGTVDSDYRGEIKVILVNLGAEPFTVHRGDRIAQLVIGTVVSVETEETAALSDTSRGEGGFGHTGT